MVLPLTHKHHGLRETKLFPFLNPTQRITAFQPHELSKHEGHGSADEGQSKLSKHPGAFPASNVQRHWRTRDNRKGRHKLIITIPTKDSRSSSYSNSLHHVLSTLPLLVTRFPLHDISYLIAILFVFGSIVWVLNAFFVWLPLVRPASAFSGETADGGGYTAFIGATIFEIGSVLLMVEAVNEKREGCMGWVLERMEDSALPWRVTKGTCTHHHGNQRNLVGQGAKSRSSDDVGFNERSGNEGEGVEKMVGDGCGDGQGHRILAWWPTWREVMARYRKDIGFWACLSQMFGATVFWISGFTALPGIYHELKSTAAQNGAYWAPQVVGGSGFIVSGILFMLETQKKWYLPALDVLGWHIGMWNLIGGIGFTLCGALGFAAANSGVEYQGSLATFWGSWCFLIGSVLQWYESLDKHPVSMKTEGTQSEHVDEKA